MAGAQAAWQRVIDSRNPELAGPAFTSVVNLLARQENVGGLRAAYLNGLAVCQRASMAWQFARRRAPIAQFCSARLLAA